MIKSTVRATTELTATPRGLPSTCLTENALAVLGKRYLVKDDLGSVVETPEDMFWRIATTIAAVDAHYGASPSEVDGAARAFYDLMVTGQFEPNSPTLMNAGRPLGQLSACFVLPIEDDMSSIYDTLKAQALIHQSGGGTGFSFSRLRPKGDIVKSTKGVASGPVSFMTVYNHSTEAVKQGGTRRGANMGVLRVDHPSILDFIHCKDDTSQITNFNISVAITDAFMRAYEADEDYDVVNPRTGAVVNRLNARMVFGEIVTCAWKTGEPGVLFIDRANAYNPVPHLGAYEATNPCGEQWLLPYDVCNLGSINLGAFVRNPDTDAATVDWDALGEVVRTATRFLDNVIDANRFPLPEITDLAQRIRRIGLGVMGWADLLVRLGVPYMSEEGVALGREVMQFVDARAKDASTELAHERGPFPEWERSIWGPDATCARDAKGRRVRPERFLRNCNVTTVAPTGTISMIAGCSSGIEPHFAVAFHRFQADMRMVDVNEDFLARARRDGWYSPGLIDRIAEQGHIHQPEVPAAVQAVFQTAHDITPEWHVRMQAAFQDGVDSSISKTTNFPNSATEADVRDIYEMAYRLGCKGVTVYRDGSRSGQVLSTGATGQTAAPAPAAAAVPQWGQLRPVALPHADLPAHRFGLDTPHGRMHMFVTESEAGDPLEVFVSIGRAGSDTAAYTEAIGRLISIALRSGVAPDVVADQLRGIGGQRSFGFGPSRVKSVPDGIGKLLQSRYLPSDGADQAVLLDTTDHAPAVSARADLCPQCGNHTFVQSEGCAKCASCGHAEC